MAKEQQLEGMQTEIKMAKKIAKRIGYTPTEEAMRKDGGEEKKGHHQHHNHKKGGSKKEQA